MKTIKHKLQITLLIFFTASLFSTVFAQEYEYVPFPTENAIWSNYQVWPSLPSPYSQMNLVYALFDDDTIMYNQTWQKVYQLTDSVLSEENAILYGYINENDKKVHFHSAQGGGGLLYDFDLNVGDTVEPDIPISLKLIVEQIDTIIIDNTKRKRFWFNESESLDNMYWIEGIGSTNGLLHPGDFVVGTQHKLLCLKQEDKTVYYNDLFGTCYPDLPNIYTALETNWALKEIKLYPNPATENVNIEFSKTTSGVLFINSMQGKLIKAHAINNICKTEISLNGIKKGIYLIHFVAENNNIVYVNKLIIN